MKNQILSGKIQGVGLKDHQIAALATFIAIEMKRRHQYLPESVRTEVSCLLVQFLEANNLRLDMPKEIA